ncbi:MAG: hypothetical protein RXQ00_07460 [Caldivirga sp.]
MSLGIIGQLTGSPLSLGIMKTPPTLIILVKPLTVTSVIHLSPAISNTTLQGALASTKPLGITTVSTRSSPWSRAMDSTLMLKSW